MNLFNCHRLCNNLRLDVSKMTNILLNQMKKFQIEVLLPGSAVPEWFSCRKGDEIATDDDVCELVIEIPRTFKWENTRLVLCAALEITEAVVGPLEISGSHDFFLLGFLFSERGLICIWVLSIVHSRFQFPICKFVFWYLWSCKFWCQNIVFGHHNWYEIARNPSKIRVQLVLASLGALRIVIYGCIIG